MATIDEDVDGLLDTLERWLASDVVPHVLELEHADEYPRAMVEQMREFGLFARDHPRGVRRARASAPARTCASSKPIARGVDVAHRRRQHAPDGGGARPPLRHRRAARDVPPALAGRRAARRARAHRARLRHRPAGGPHHRDARRRRLRAARHQDVDHQRAARATASRCSSRPTSAPSPATAACRCSSCPRTSGYTVTRKLGKLGYKGIDTVRGRLRRRRRPRRPPARRGRRAAASTRRSARSSSGASTSPRVGWAWPTPRSRRRSRYAQQRHTMGKPIAEHQAIQLKLADMACRVESARLLTQRGRGRVRPRERCDLEAGMAKLVRVGGRARERHRGDAHPRRLRLLHRGPHRALLPRRPAAVHRRGHQRDPADHHRPPARRPQQRGRLAVRARLHSISSVGSIPFRQSRLRARLHLSPMVAA